MPVYTFDKLPQEYVTPKYSTGKGGSITASKIEVSLLSYAPGTGAVAHQHPQEQIMVVVRGKLRLRSGDTDVILGPMEGFVMDSNVLHQVTVEGDEELVVFSCKNLVDGKGHKI